MKESIVKIGWLASHLIKCRWFLIKCRWFLIKCRWLASHLIKCRASEPQERRKMVWLANVCIH